MRRTGPKRSFVALLVLASACARGAKAPTPTPTRQASTPAPSAPVPCRYAFPVQPPGVTHYGRYHHDYPATDIFAPRGSRVVSPVDGSVNYVSRVDRWVASVNDPATRGGLSVAIIGDDGIRYYGSHLLDVSAGIEPGVRVRAGDEIGHVDSSGNAEGIDAHLHFGISHPTTPDDWAVRRGEVSPYDDLNAWKVGQPRTPVVPGSLRPKCAPVH